MEFKKVITFLTCFISLIAGYFQVSVIKGNKDNQLERTSPQTSDILVNLYIKGEVNIEGLYEVSPTSTIYEVVYEYAGGFTGQAAINCIDLYSPIEDIYDISSNVLYLTIPNHNNPSCTIVGSESGPSNGLININTASAELLQTINGIGEVTAANIITYRNNNGYFKRIEDIMNVTGISTNKFESIKSYITV